MLHSLYHIEDLVEQTLARNLEDLPDVACPFDDLARKDVDKVMGNQGFLQKLAGFAAESVGMQLQTFHSCERGY